MLYPRNACFHTNIFRYKYSKLPLPELCFEIFPYLALFLEFIYSDKK